MLTLYEKIDFLCKSFNTNVSKMCRELEISRSTLSELKAGRSKTLSTETLSKIANHFGTTVDKLISDDLYQTEPDRQKLREAFEQKEMPALTKKDERDIEKKLNETLEELELSQDSLMFNGEPLDDITKELLIQSIRNGIELSKRIAKEKYTPKKYKK